MSALASHPHCAGMIRSIPATAMPHMPPREPPSLRADGDRPSIRDCPACGSARQLVRRPAGSGVGYTVFCPGCNSDRQRQYRKAHPGFSAEKNRRWQTANPEKRAAHMAVRNALRNGTLTKGPCAHCGTTKRVEAHHEDYAKPLVVTWLCRTAHLARHREMAAEAQAALHQRLLPATQGVCHV